MSPPRTRSLRRVSGALAATLLLLACRPLAPQRSAPDWFRAPGWNAGEERYSAWFADSDGEVLYFGLSPFWTLWWATDGDATADLRVAGEHLIGRFDLRRERFLEPLRVRGIDDRARGSVWDVLAHSNGRIYYTTYYDETGSVARDGSDVRHDPGTGPGLNELVEGPDGRIFVTRYSARPSEAAGSSGEGAGSIAVLHPEGGLERELPLPYDPGTFVAPKSLAVDPLSGEIWLNTDTFMLAARGVGEPALVHETLRLSPEGKLLERSAAPPELLFPAFDRAGRGWLAERMEGRLRLRVREPEGAERVFDLGPLPSGDFVQDIRFTPDGTALLALWSHRVIAVGPPGRKDVPHIRSIPLRVPSDCAPPRGRSLVYTAVGGPRGIYATLFCGATILRAPW